MAIPLVVTAQDSQKLIWELEQSVDHLFLNRKELQALLDVVVVSVNACVELLPHRPLGTALLKLDHGLEAVGQLQGPRLQLLGCAEAQFWSRAFNFKKLGPKAKLKCKPLAIIVVGTQRFHDVVVWSLEVLVICLDAPEAHQGGSQLRAVDLVRGEPLRFNKRDDQEADHHLRLAINVAN